MIMYLVGLVVKVMAMIVVALALGLSFVWLVFGDFSLGTTVKGLLACLVAYIILKEWCQNDKC